MRLPFVSNKVKQTWFVCLSNATSCSESNEVTSRSFLTRASEAAVQSLLVAMALAACNNARYRPSSTRGKIDAVTIGICPSQIDRSAVAPETLLFSRPETGHPQRRETYIF